MRLLLAIVSVLALMFGIGVSYYWLSELHGFELMQRTPFRTLGLVFAVAGLTSVNLLLRWLRWNFFLRRFHVRLPTRDTFRAFFAALPASFTPLYVGELLRGMLLSWRRSQLMPVVAWVWLVERCCDVAALLVIWGCAAARADLVLPGLVGLAAAPWLLAYSTMPRVDHLRLHTAQLRPSGTMVAGICLSLVAWLMPALAMQIALRGFGAGVSPALAAVAFARGTLLGGLSAIPGGSGIAGSTMIITLLEHEVASAPATAAVAVLRMGTHGYALMLGLGLAFVWRHSLVRLLRARHSEQQHFDELSTTYAQGIPESVRLRLLSRKVDLMIERLPDHDGSTLRGLDLGCGHGWYAAELARRGYIVSGIDVSKGQIEQAKDYCRGQGRAVELAVYDGCSIPYPDGYFDFAYSINVLHHVASPAEQERLLKDVLRVLKRGAVFFLHEMNVENPIFRVYMSYIFPLLKSIDEGTELWLLPSRLPEIDGGAWQPERVYFTFLPEFLPSLGHRMFEPLERWMERSGLRRYAAHYMAALRRD